MISLQHILIFLGAVVVIAPLLLAVLLGLSSLLDLKVTEQTTTRAIQAAIASGLVASVAVLAGMLISGERHLASGTWYWIVIPGRYHFSVKFVFDRLSVPFAILSFVLSGTIGAFATKYLHNERGFNRFFVLYALFVLGMVVTSLAGTIETLFAGWELVGLSSALLVAFFHERAAPSRNGLWVWTIYRVSDAALLLAAVTMHHLRGEGDFDSLLGGGSWPYEYSSVTSNQALLVGLLIVVAAAGKSALVPFSGWLPRAMEGPTPSSAVFYGALSVHLGAFLLLRVSPLLERSIPLCVLLVILGLATAVLAYLAGSVQTDIKSVLSFASLSQVGIIVAEIGVADLLSGIGTAVSSHRLATLAIMFKYIALTHLLGHACLRTLQFLRAPTLLHDYHTLENAIGEHLPTSSSSWRRMAATRSRPSLYRFALERGYLDTLLKLYIVEPFQRVFRWCDSLERRWTDFLTGKASRESEQDKNPFGTIEEFS
ncbi:MAG: NADH:ubiquinone oxidoreductase subunit 5 (chain L)/multisubunit Na+/H+ antiporter, MnhA subunit [Planctomycetota bacterium]|nr:NADH:ubiquinone oxidoreductase subunit 5 (chain L)/multisubunit Na+/H+ antiporter, MnhA subunit [Planctomycetota bacterium]